MFLLKTLLCGVLLNIVSGLTFNNPVINLEDFGDPSALQVGDLYYITSNSDNLEANGNGIPIYESKDLQTWTNVGYVFDNTNHPVWSTRQSYWAPEIHLINDLFVVVFATMEDSSKKSKIGVAISTNITGSYHSFDRPLLQQVEAYDPNIFSYNNENYLLYRTGNSINMVQLSNDGLSIPASDKSQVILSATSSEWEKGLVDTPWMMHRNVYYYLFYSGGTYCDSGHSLGVARSKNIWGPYEKLGRALLSSTPSWIGRSAPTMVNYVDNVILLHQATPVGSSICNSGHRKVFGQTILWSTDDWPTIV